MLVTCTNLSKVMGAKNLFENISFTIEDNDKIAILGVNGTGKSTLLKIIAGLENYEGEMLKRSNLTINYLGQNPDFLATNTVMEQVYNSIDKKEVPVYQVESMLNKLGITNYTQKIGELSGGQQKRVALTIALLTKCDLLILDEPTNHLDSDMIEYLEKYLVKFNKAIIMVSHDRYFLDRVVNNIYEISNRKLEKYTGNYTKYLEEKQNREEIAINTQKKRDLFLRKELEWVRAGVQARTTKSKDRLQRFEELNATDRIDVKKDVSMVYIQQRLGKKTINFNNLSMAYDDNVLFTDFTYTCSKVDRIGILGVNGSGKSTLIRLIAGEIVPTNGSVELGETVKVGYFKQGNDDLDLEKKVIDYIKDVSDSLDTSEGQFSARQLCERFLFDSTLQYTKIKYLSGGQKRRLNLLRVLMHGPNVLLFDEPTNDLDIQTLTILEDYLDSFNGVVIVVCHDRYFLDRVCDKVFVFKDKKITVVNGGYSQYIELDTKSKSKNENSAKEYAMEKQRQRQNTPKLSAKEIKELEGMEEEINALESLLEELDEQMQSDALDFKKMEDISMQRIKVENDIEIKSARWMELLEIQEQIQNLKNNK